MKELEVWADSFHEGLWAVENLGSFFRCIKTEYIHGFIPFFTFNISEDETALLKVFGSFQSWSPIPEPIKNLISYGKPDIIFYDPEKEKIILAIEETAAVPTGNQALQRCERVFGSAYNSIPFVYLIGEFGVHSNGGIRRTSIWPTLLGLKLSLQFQIPSLSLHYSDLENPEDYQSGTGLSKLFQYTSLLILKNFELLNDTNRQVLTKLQNDILKVMNEFIVDQHVNIVKYFPWAEYMKTEKCSEQMAKRILDEKSNLPDDFLVWPKSEVIFKNFSYHDIQTGFLVEDSFLNCVDNLVKNRKAYVISPGVGSRPQNLEKIQEWIQAQRDNTSNAPTLKKPLKYKCDITKFPKTKTGLYHITTSKNITYFIDDLKDLEICFKRVFKRNSSLLEIIENDNNLPIFLYISNALLPNRIFGDPYTGQFSAFVNIFAYDNKRNKNRLAIMYLPYTTAGCFFNNNGKLKKNKGTKIYSMLADAIITNNGYVITLKDGGKIYD